MKRLKIVSIVSISMLLLLATFSSVANAWNTENLYNITFDGESSFTNYDFESEDASSDNVDWATAVIFWGPDAEVDNAKGLLWSYVGSTMKLHYDDGETVDFDSDKGRKTDPTDMDGWHTRIYAPSDTDRFECGVLGYYVVATAHRDWLIHWFWPQYGYTSDAADHVMDKAEDTVGSNNVDDQFAYLYNYESFRIEGSPTQHVWEHDGWSRGVYMD